MEKKTQLNDLMRSAMEKVREMADTNAIVGQPITTPDGVTLIPISKVSMGFGCGGGDYGKAQPRGFGGGSGAGVTVSPVAFLSIHNGNVRVIQIEPYFSPVDRALEKIPDIADIFKNDFSVFAFITQYCADNPEMEPEKLDKIITKLRAIGNRSIGVIELSEHLDIDVVTDIFIRINSKGTALSQGDFVMSKIASDEIYGGNILRKAIDYFAHLAVEPSFARFISREDTAFAATEYWPKISWLKDERDDVYDPDYDDVIGPGFRHKRVPGRDYC